MLTVVLLTRTVYECAAAIGAFHLAAASVVEVGSSQESQVGEAMP